MSKFIKIAWKVIVFFFINRKWIKPIFRKILSYGKKFIKSVKTGRNKSKFMAASGGFDLERKEGQSSNENNQVYKQEKIKDMSEKRKGLLTPEQEKLIDELKKWDNIAAEAADGIIISLADNQGLEYAKKEFLKKYPEAEDELYLVVDGIMSVVAAAVTAKE